jgi:O-antigen/teichoic acid export membrane protein
MGRALGPYEYGVFGSLFAISYIIFVLTQTIQTGSARFVSKFIGENQNKKINVFARGLLKRMFLLGITLFIFIVLISGPIASFLKIDSIYPVIILASIFIFSTLLPVNLGILQGLENFISLGFATIIIFLAKLILGILLVWIGFGVNGAIGGVVLGFLVALIFSYIPLKKYFLQKNIKEEKFNFSELYVYSFPTIIAMFCFSVPSNVDVIIAKHFFTSQIAGIYTAVTVLGKIILFVPGAIAIVMFPKISRLYTEKKDTSYVLNISLIYTGILAGIIALGYWFFPYLAITIPYGVDYIEAVPILRLYGIAMFFFSLTVVLMRYSLAINHLKYVYLLIFFTLTEIGLLSIFHDSLMMMVEILLIVNIILFLSSYIYLTIVRKKIQINQE